MPDGYTPATPSASAALGSIGAGLLDTYFPALHQERERVERDKKYERDLQMQALHDLIASGKTQVKDVPRLMKMHADLAGIGKLPGVQEIITNMEQAANSQQVPYGPEQTRTVDKAQFGVEAPAPAPAGLQVPSIQLMQVPPEPGQPRVAAAATAPRVGAPDLLGLNRQAATLRTVPTEETFQPTRAAGDLTQDEYADVRKTGLYTAQQEAMLKRQSQLAEEAGERQADREAARALSQADQIRLKAQEARTTQEKLFENKIKMLEPEMQAKAKLRTAQIAAAISAQNPGLDPAEVQRRAGDLAFAEVQVGVEVKKAQVEKSKAQIQHWKNVDARELIKAKGGLATEGMTAAQARTFRMNTLDIIGPLNMTRSQLEKLKTDQALLGGADPTIQQRITELSAQQEGLLLRLNEERQKVLSQVQTQSAPGAQQSARPASDPLGLFK